MKMAIEVIRENIECEQLLGENTCDTIIKAEYIIPDTHPDVVKILNVDSKPFVISKEIMKDKVYLEGQIEYNIIYLAKEEEDRMGIYNVTYTGKFANYVDVPGAEYRMECEYDCYIEHMESNIINERKISVEGVIKLKAEVYRNYTFEIIKDIENSEDIQMLKNPMEVDKIVGTVNTDMVAKCNMKVSEDKPEIGNILKCEVNIHRKDIRVMEDKIIIEASALIDLLYRGKDTRDIVALQEDVAISKEVDFEGINSRMENYTDFKVDAMEINIKEDEMGENRIIDIEALVKAATRIMFKEEMDIIQDAYSPHAFMEMKKENYKLNVTHGQARGEVVVKGDIEIDKDMPKVSEIIMCSGKVCITDRRIVEDKVIVEGVLNVNVMYSTRDENNYICSISEEIPFTCPIELAGCKIEMQSIAKAFLENIEASIEAGNIAVKSVVEIYVRVNYTMPKEFLIDISPIEGEMPKKKSSVTIYVVQNGDTLWKIAKRYFTTVDNLIKINNIENPDIIKPGEKLIIPGRASL